jgi:hypothetical protein
LCFNDLQFHTNIMLSLCIVSWWGKEYPL